MNLVLQEGAALTVSGDLKCKPDSGYVLDILATLNVRGKMPGAELFPQDAVLRLEIVNHVALLLMNPAGHRDEQEL